MKVSELTGSALDWAVAKCEGMLGEPWLWGDDNEVLLRYKFSTNWAKGGPIIEREQIGLDPFADYPRWQAFTPAPEQKDCQPVAYGPTPLIAAMRCYVASKLGDEVELPKELG